MHAIFDSFDSFEILEDSIQCFGIRDLVYTSLSFQLWLKVEDRKFNRRDVLRANGTAAVPALQE
jgi:hypothetical protein